MGPVIGPLWRTSWSRKNPHSSVGPPALHLPTGARGWTLGPVEEFAHQLHWQILFVGVCFVTARAAVSNYMWLLITCERNVIVAVFQFLKKCQESYIRLALKFRIIFGLATGVWVAGIAAWRCSLSFVWGLSMMPIAFWDPPAFCLTICRLLQEHESLGLSTYYQT